MMRPSELEYHKANSLEQALTLLDLFGDDGRPIAGGQSLMPMMNLRLARPMYLVDIGGLDLDAIEQDGDLVRIGALVCHERHLSDPLIARHFPAIVEGVESIGHPTIRRNGTMGGSIAHCDPTAELCLLTMLHDAQIVVASAKGERRLAADGFFEGAYTTILEPGEMIVAVELPIPPACQAGAFTEIAERRGDFAIVACGVTVLPDGDRVGRISIAVSGASDVAMRAPALEEALQARALDKPDPTGAIADFVASLSPPHDHSASADYRRALIAELLGRTIKTACTRALEKA